MAIKVHILYCDEPHVDGTPATVSCGLHMPNATAAVMIDWDAISLGDESIFDYSRICVHCRKAEVKRSRYLFGLIFSEEAEQLRHKRTGGLT